MSTIFEDIEVESLLECALTKAARKACEEKQLQSPQQFLELVVQLHNLLRVRHGVLLLGPTFSGKTTAYRVLASALASMKVHFES